MRVTNKFGLPETLVKAVSYDMHPRKGFSVTDLISPPRIVQLTRRHYDEIEVDASERIWVLLGSSIHAILERIDLPECQKETTLKAKVNGTVITGRSDLWHNHKLDDWKITSVWAVLFQPQGRKDWHAQLNMYRWLHKINEQETNELEICALLRDWQANKVEGDYPPIPIVIIPIPIWADSIIENYIYDRVKAHTDAIKISDDELPLCTDEDMWAKPTQYALKNKRKKQAVAVFYSEEEAQNRLNSIVEGRGYYIEVRPGRRPRCERFCDASPFCNQYEEYKRARQKGL